MNGIYSIQTIEKFKNLKKIFQKIAVWSLISGIVLGVLLILVNGDDAWEIMIAKVIGSVSILALALMISSNNFRRIEDGDKKVQVLATISLIGNALWFLLWILAIWEVYQVVTTVEVECDYAWYRTADSLCTNTILSPLGCFACVMSTASAFGFLASNIMSIKEHDRKSTILPLKITATVCLIYESLYAIIRAILSASNVDLKSLDDKFAILASFTGTVWFIVTIVALVLSKNAQSKTQTPNVQVASNLAQPQEDPEAKMRAEIEARVRAEMYEKEIRAKIQAEYDALNNQNNQTDPTNQN